MPEGNSRFSRMAETLVVAGVIAITGMMLKLVVDVGDMKGEIARNRAVTCTFAKKLDVVLGECRQ